MKPHRKAGQGMALTAVLLLGACASAQTGPERTGTGSGPICARAEVVRFVSREIRRHAPYTVLLTETIGERPSPDPMVVLCAVTMVRKDYDYRRYWSQSWAENQEYTVRRLDHGYEVSLRDRIEHSGP